MGFVPMAADWTSGKNLLKGDRYGKAGPKRDRLFAERDREFPRVAIEYAWLAPAPDPGGQCLLDGFDISALSNERSDPLGFGRDGASADGFGDRGQGVFTGLHVLGGN